MAEVHSVNVAMTDEEMRRWHALTLAVTALISDTVKDWPLPESVRERGEALIEHLPESAQRHAMVTSHTINMLVFTLILNAKANDVPWEQTVQTLLHADEKLDETDLLDVMATVMSHPKSTPQMVTDCNRIMHSVLSEEQFKEWKEATKEWRTEVH